MNQLAAKPPFASKLVKPLNIKKIVKITLTN
jgi:hypothetical protein